MLAKNKSALNLVFIATLLSGFFTATVYAKEVKQTYNDLTVNANVVMAEGKTFADDVVLFTHGTLTHNGREPYGAIQELLAENGISSVAPNLSLGINDRHGEYDCNSLQTHKHDDAMQEIDFWMTWLKSKGAKSVTLMGHSRGGNQTAWYSVENDSEMIKNVVLLAPQTWSKEAEYADYKKKYGTDLSALFNKANDLVKQGKGQNKLTDTDFIYCKKATVTAEAFVSYYIEDERMDTPVLLKKALKPTLVVIGSADNVVADLADKMTSVNNDKVSSYVVEDSDHFFLDLFTEELVDEAVAFIQQ